MRIRNAALAAATAIAVAFAGTSVASATDTSKAASVPPVINAHKADTAQTFLDDEAKANTGKPSFSSKINETFKLDAGKGVTAKDVFGGSSKDGKSTTDFKDLPGWAKALTITGWAGLALSILGLIVAPIANFLQFGLKK